MGKILLLIALCVLPALVSATRMVKNPMVVQGHVYYNRCCAGFKTQKTKNMAGAKVKMECSNKKTDKVVYKREGYTDSTGQYKIVVSEDHLDQICDVVLVKSSQPECAQLSLGRERAYVILTNFNGIASNTCYANSMGFMVDEAEAGCAEVMKLYQKEEE